MEDSEAVIARLKEENAALKKQNLVYAKLVDKSWEEIVESNPDDDAVETAENKKTEVALDMGAIRERLEDEDDRYVLDLIHSGQIEQRDLDTILSLATECGRMAVVRDCVNAGAIIHEYTLNTARQTQNFSLIEFLMLRRSGFGTGKKVSKDCAEAWDESAVLDAFLTLCAEDTKSQLSSILVQMVHERKPISSFLINLGMHVDADNMWKALKQTMQAIIADTEDALGWTYLRKYLLNSTFLFRQYRLQPKKDEDKDKDKEEEKSAEGRMIRDLNGRELLVYLEKVNATVHEMDDTDMAKMNAALRRENINGEKYSKMDYNLFKAFLEGAGLPKWPSDKFTYYIKLTLSSETPIAFAVPFVEDDEDCLNTIIGMATAASTKEAENDIGSAYRAWTECKEDWDFVMKFGEEFDGGKRLRQDDLEKGVKGAYAKNTLIKGLRGNFDPLRFYNLEIYLNLLMMECGVMNDAFQTDVESMFDGMRVKYRRGPLKKGERCQVKVETDYCDEQFPTSACLLDIVRCTVTFESMKEMIDGIKHFQQQVADGKYCVKEILRIKNGFRELNAEDLGYADLKFNVKMEKKNLRNETVELIAEVQFLLKDMMTFKKKSHKYYGIIRQKEYFDVFKDVQIFRNDVSNQINIALQNVNDKKLTEIILDLNIKSWEVFQTVCPTWRESLTTLYANANDLKCLGILMSLAPTKLDFLKTQFHHICGSGLGVAVAHGNMELVKSILLCLETDEQRKQVIQVGDADEKSAMHFARELMENGDGGEMTAYLSKYSKTV